MKRIPHRIAARLVLVALIAFGCAQAGALAHAYAHDATLRATALSGERLQQLPAPASHAACDACLAYAPLLSAAAAPAALSFMLSHAPIETRDGPSRPHLDDSLSLAFRSRAPPSAA